MNTMKKLIYVFIALIGVIGAAVTWVYNSHSGRDALFRQGIKTFMDQTPETFDGIRVVVCGSASPLGNDLTRVSNSSPSIIWFRYLRILCPRRCLCVDYQKMSSLLRICTASNYRQTPQKSTSMNLKTRVRSMARRM